MKKLHAAALAVLLLAAPAFGASTINPAVPAQNSPMSSAPIRNNFNAAYNDINSILGNYSGILAPNLPYTSQLWRDTGTTPSTLKMYDGVQWVAVGRLDSTAHTYSWAGSAVTPAYGGTGQDFSGSTGVVIFTAGVASVGSVPPASIPAPTPTTLGGVFSLASSSHQFLNAIGTDGTPGRAQPAFTDISGTIATGQVSGSYTGITGVGTLAAGATGAGFTIDLSTSTVSGTLPTARLSGSYTGVTGVGTLTAGTWNATAVATQYGGLGANNSASTGVPLFATGTVTMTATSGTGNIARVTSPAFTTPDLGTPSALTLTNATGTPSSIGLANGTGLPVSGLAALAANTVVANRTGSSASPTAFAMPSCPDSGGNHINWVSGTGFTCGTSGTATSLTVGTTSIASGTTGRIEYNNGGTLGEYTITGTAGSAVMSVSPTTTGTTTISGSTFTTSRVSLITDTFIPNNGCYGTKTSGGTDVCSLYLTSSNDWHLGDPGVNANFFFYSNGGTIANINSTTGVYTPTSDERLKNIHASQRDWWPVINNLWVGEYDWKATGALGFGVRAQQAYAVMPEHLGAFKPANDNDRWGADPGTFGYLALWGVKGLKADNDNLKKRVTALESDVASLKADVAALKAAAH